MGEPTSRRPLRWLVASAICTVALLTTPQALADSDNGEISGTVSLDPKLTDSTLDGIWVTAESGPISRSAPVDDEGEYELKDLPDGSYVVWFGANLVWGGDVTLLTEYYDNVYTAAAAKSVVVADGEHVKGIDAQLSRTGHFTSAPIPTVVASKLTVGSTLGSKTGIWAPGSPTFTYKWKRDGATIKGATKSTYKVVAADRGHKISLTVTGSTANFTAVSRTSSSVSIPKVFSKTPKPTITGKAESGKTLTAHRGTWSPTPSYSYQWYRSGAKISGATKSTYKLTSKDKGKKITVKVTGKKSGYLTVTKTSAAKIVSK